MPGDNIFAHCPDCGARMDEVCQECGFVSSYSESESNDLDDRHWVDEDREDEYHGHDIDEVMEWDDRD